MNRNTARSWTSPCGTAGATPDPTTRPRSVPVPAGAGSDLLHAQDPPAFLVPAHNHPGGDVPDVGAGHFVETDLPREGHEPGIGEIPRMDVGEADGRHVPAQNVPHEMRGLSRFFLQAILQGPGDVEATGTVIANHEGDARCHEDPGCQQRAQRRREGNRLHVALQGGLCDIPGPLGFFAQAIPHRIRDGTGCRSLAANRQDGGCKQKKPTSQNGTKRRHAGALSMGGESQSPPN
ncbi:protein of unknown function [Rhodovastum atsumiense]|nr:protein of unknown function [Rhodovastum atsumiense]